MTNYIRANVAPSSASINSSIRTEANINSDLRTNDNIFSNPSTYNTATTTRKGIIRIATDEEAIEGISDNTAITPSTLRLITNFEFEQAIASDIWTIEHNLNKYPSVTVVDSADNVVIGSIEYVDENNIIINFNGVFKGKAYLN